MVLPVAPINGYQNAKPLMVAHSDTGHVVKIPYSKRYTGKKYNKGTEALLRISNGGAGQSGLVGALASAFIDYTREKRLIAKDYCIDWVQKLITGDTTESIAYLQTGDADIAITYNAAAEKHALALGIATRREYAFRDHFYLIGPPSNPAGLDSQKDTVYDMFNKIVTTGNEYKTPPTRFLSRYDKSATNIKESLLFAEIGQIPWAYAYSKWYHQYPQYPVPSLTAAAELEEYTLTDRGTFLTVQSANPKVVENVVVYKTGGDKDPDDPLLNPAAVLQGNKGASEEGPLADIFMDWIIAEDGGQEVIKTFQKPGTVGYLYTPAPDRKTDRAHRKGW